MNSKQSRSEYLANITMVKVVKPNWQNPAPIRVIAKRVTRGFFAAILASVFNVKG
jgi:hypothetical protein